MAQESKNRPPAAIGRAGGYAPLADFRGQMDRLFDDFFGGWLYPSRGPGEPAASVFPFTTPEIEVAETDEGLEVTAELPGIDEKDIDVTLHNGLLTIKGEKKEAQEKKEKNYLLSERRYGSFQRSIRLPESIDENKVKAAFDKGVLKVSVGRVKGSKPGVRRIPIGR